jgi:hypothetical protein
MKQSRPNLLDLDGCVGDDGTLRVRDSTCDAGLLSGQYRGRKQKD